MTQPLQTEELLTSERVQVVDIAGRPTITIEDGLSVLTAVNSDTDFQPSRAILGRLLVPTPELVEQMLTEPIDDVKVEQNWDTRQGLRWLGHQTMHRAMAEQGLNDVRDLWGPPPQPNEKGEIVIPPYFRLYDGGVLHDIEKLDGEELPTWGGIIGKYGANDPVVIDFFARLKESVRVDAAGLLSELSTLVRFDTIFSPEEATLRRVTDRLDNFLLDQGYEPDPSPFIMVKMAK